jgi:GNAT superfamily N-acetyltransferase
VADVPTAKQRRGGERRAGASDEGAAIRRLEEGAFEAILQVINDGAAAYRGVVPADRLAEPYMSASHLRDEIQAGVVFWGWEDRSGLGGVMGIQDVREVTLIRHAYVRTDRQGQGIGGQLIAHLRTLTERPILIGTWAAASWAIHFYEKHGFRLVSPDEKERLLRTYWTIPARQVQTSVVLADERAFAHAIVAG